MSVYQTFLDALGQLEQDQSLYEADLGGPELQGVQHEEIIKLGGRLCKRLKKFADEGQTFAETLPPDFTSKLTDTIQTYQNLIVPPKIMGGFCPCLKPARSGPEYEKKLLNTKSKMVAALFVVQAVIIESRGEVINMNSMHYADYVNKMNTVFNSLDIKVGGGEKSLENARQKLLVALEGVEKFIGNFGENNGNKEFQQEAKRRIRSTQELLTSRTTEASSPLPLSARVLVKAQSSLQEILNSAAAIALTEAKSNLNRLEDLTKALKKARDQEVAAFNAMEEDMQDSGLMEALHRLREDSEIAHSDAGSKLRDCVKRWTSIKSQSNARKVAEYREEGERTLTSGDAINPSKVARDAKIKLTKGVSQMTNTVGDAGSDIGNVFQKGFADIGGGINKGIGGIKKLGDSAVKDIQGALNINQEPPPPPPKTGLAKMADTIMGTEQPAAGGKKKTTKKKNGGVFEGVGF